MEYIDKLIGDIICIVKDEEVQNPEQYIKMEVETHKEEIINAIIEEIKQCL